MEELGRDQLRWKDIGLNDPVSITLPASVWHGFICSYMSQEWNSSEANCISRAAQEEMLDPVFVKEKQAAWQQQQSMQTAAFKHAFPGMIFPGSDDPEVPPNPGDLE